MGPCKKSELRVQNTTDDKDARIGVFMKKNAHIQGIEMTINACVEKNENENDEDETEEGEEEESGGGSPIVGIVITVIVFLCVLACVHRNR